MQKSASSINFFIFRLSVTRTWETHYQSFVAFQKKVLICFPDSGIKISSQEYYGHGMSPG